MDVSYFGPLTHYYSRLVEDFISIATGQGVTKREYTEWILKAMEKVNSEKVVNGAFAKTGLVPFNPDIVLAQLKYPKEWPYNFDFIEFPAQFFNRIEAEIEAEIEALAAAAAAANEAAEAGFNKPFTFPDQQPSPFIDGMFTVQNRTEKIRIPIDHEYAGKLLTRIIANIPNQEIYLHSLAGFHKYNGANETIQKAQNEKLIKVVVKKKPNTKKTIGSSHYDKDVRDATNHKNQLNKEAKAQAAIEKEVKKKQKAIEKEAKKKQKAIADQKNKEDKVAKAAEKAANGPLKRKNNRKSVRQSLIDESMFMIIEEENESADSIYYDADEVLIDQLEATVAANTR